MKNPYMRLLELTNLSQSEFCRRYGFATSTMTYIASGQYPKLSDRMITALGEACHHAEVGAKDVLVAEYGRDTLQEAYSAWKLEERWLAHGKFVALPVGGNKTKSPFQLFVETTVGSTQGFAKMLKVPSVSVKRYATGMKTTQTAGVFTMPEAIVDALSDVEYPYLDELIEMQNEWLATR